MQTAAVASAFVLTLSALAKPFTPKAPELIAPKSTLIVCPQFAPTCNVTVVALLNIA